MLFGLVEENGSERGIEQKKVDAELACDGKLGGAELLRCRVRYFSDGLAIALAVGMRRRCKLSRFRLTVREGVEACRPKGGMW